VVTKATSFEDCAEIKLLYWNCCWNSLTLVNSEFPELTLTHYSAIQETNIESKGAGVGENFQLCVEKHRHIHKYRSIHLLLKVFDEAHSISELFKVSEDLGIIELGFAMLITWLVKCKWGRTQQGAIASNDVKEESHSFHILWSISVACAVGPSANLLPNWFLLSKPVFVTLLNFQWLKPL